MPTINIAITATNAQLSKFADELGYMPDISDIDENGEVTVIPNPQTKAEFLMERLKGITVNSLSDVRIKAVEQAVRDERETEKQTIKNGISDAVDVTAA